MIDIVVYALVVYRAAHMLAVEEGPFELFALLRDRIDPRQDTWYGRGINCVLCISFWLAALVAFAMPGNYFVNWFAVAGLAAVMHKETK